MRRLVVGSVVVFAFGIGCGSESGNDGRSVALADVPAELAGAACQALQGCYGDLYELVLPGEDCEARVREQLSEAVTALEDAIDAGTARYRGERMRDCLSQLRRADCNLDAAFASQACLAALDGTVELGGDCQSSLECEGDAFCRNTGVCPGQCVATKAAGTVCDDDNECQPGLACSPEQGCYAPPREGAACGGSAPENCADGAFCVGDSDVTSGECRAPEEIFTAESGDPCSIADGRLCAPDLSCTILGVQGTTVEAECAPRVAAGAACTLAVPDQCPVDQYCEVTNRATFSGACKAKPTAGQPCAPGPFDDSPPQCAPNLRCDGGTCRARQPLGAACESDEACRSENCARGRCALEGSCE
jgi:hypothetical protein